MTSIKDIILEIQSDTAKILADDFGSSSSIITAGLTELDEVDLYDINALAPKTIKSVNFEIVEEGGKELLINGIDIPKEPIEKNLSGLAVAAVDGSRTVIVRSTISALIARAAAANFVQKKSWPEPLGEIKDTRVEYVVANRLSIHSSLPPEMERKVVTFNNKTDYLPSIRGRINRLEAETEINTAEWLINSSQNDYDMLILDGPLYRIGHTVSDLQKSAKMIRNAIYKGITPVAVVKRPLSKIYRDFACDQLGCPTFQWIGDLAFLETILTPGTRSPFFTMVTKGIEVEHLTPNEYRLCCYLRLPNGRIVRIEMPKVVEDMKENLIETILALSRYNGGRLPQPQSRAHRLCTIDRKKRKNIETIFDNQLRKKKIPTTRIIDGDDLK